MPPPWPPILLASARSSGVSVVSSRRRYRAAFRLDEPVLIVSRRRASTMLLHLSRSGARFSTECRWWVTWLRYRHFALPGDVLDLQVPYAPQVDPVPPAVVGEPDEGVVAARAADD